MSKSFYSSAKRVFDLIVSGAAIAATSPLLLAISVLIKLTSPGPIMFRQVRAGRDGLPFEIYKFRTMADAPSSVSEAIYDWADGVPDNFVFKTSAAGEQRITPIGHYLRRLSLDELPQFLNVWRGEMSLVGPRPELLSITRCYSAQQRRRLRALPGITGWAQVSGRSSLNHGRKIEADLYYIDHASFAFDLRVLAKTVHVAVTGSHAY